MSFFSDITAGIGAATGLYNSHKDRKTQREENQKQRDWETEMSNTAYQRQVEDLKEAGLNPASALSMGATTPTGGNAPMPTSASASQSITTAMQFLNEYKKIQSEQDLNRSITAKNQEETKMIGINNQTNEALNLAKLEEMKQNVSSAKQKEKLEEAETRLKHQIEHDMTISDERRKNEEIEALKQKSPIGYGIFRAADWAKDFLSFLKPKKTSITKNYTGNYFSNSAKATEKFG
ncbi:DNA pilot protein [Sigmofec virus UA08Rod_5336]|uniref:DNA pilot protein n=1 Tax=Sigmofec virus UA08Rod_5336 TaxID=2929419 RepID=A0A976N1W4_9VIRU|nr:DNA pilot protein [Sigmofec virus UA08Rod_5336]